MTHDPRHELAPGTIAADRFAIGQVLGRGATSIVYRARDQVLGHDVALKVLRGAQTAGSIAAQRFEREARLMSRLHHPAIVRLHASGWLETRQPWLALELLDGETLEARLARETRLSPRCAIAIAADVLDGLAEAHWASVLHRDLKPANLMVAGDRAKILDFGVGRDLAETGPRITAPLQVVGTIGYLAPEQLEGWQTGASTPASIGSPAPVPPVRAPSALPYGTSGASTPAMIDDRADLWAVGVVFYSMLTGTAPFGLRSARVLARILESDPAPPSTLAPGIAPEIDAFVARSLAKDPEDRWPSATAMRRALLELPGAVSPRPDPPGPPSGG